MVNDMENVLESIGVTKNYAGKAAVENVSLKLETGLVYAMLGPNGSGKTTWMKMVAGLVKPGKGEILYKGKAIGKESKKEIAYMSTEPYFYSWMTVADVGRYYQDFLRIFNGKISSAYKDCIINNRFSDYRRSSFIPDTGKNNVLAGMPVKEQILCSLFHSVTARTAGFNTTDTGALTEGSKLVTMILMFIGGSPGSTAGGIKTTTVVVLIVFVRANLMEAAGCNVFNRRLDETAIRKASVVMCTNLFLILTGTIFMEIMQPFSLSDVMFEVFSAMGTVGMSAGITRDVCMASRMVLVFLMFCGRIGSLTFALSLKGHRHGAPIRKPVEEITIG